MMTLHIASASAASVPMRTGMVVVGVDRRRAVVGRDRDDLAAVVARLGDVVVPVDVRVDGVGVPDERQLGEEPVVHRATGIEQAPGQVTAGAEVLELGVAVGRRRAEQRWRTGAPGAAPGSGVMQRR